MMLVTMLILGFSVNIFVLYFTVALVCFEQYSSHPAELALRLLLC